MPSNIEIKARAGNPERLRMLAERLSDTSPQIIEQHDTFFFCKRGRLKLRQFSAQSGELISYSRPDVSGAKQSDYAIACTSSPADLLAVLSAALAVQRTVTKTRVLLRVGQTRIHLDSVLGLGSFVELEVVLREDQSPEDGRRIIRELMIALEIQDSDLLEGAYVDLFQSHQMPSLRSPLNDNSAPTELPVPKANDNRCNRFPLGSPSPAGVDLQSSEKHWQIRIGMNPKVCLRLPTAFWVKPKAVHIIVILVAVALTLPGCSRKPALSVANVRTMDFKYGNSKTRRASPAEVASFVAAYAEARVCPDDMETTGGAYVVVTNTSGGELWMRGGEEPYISVYFGKDGLCTFDGKRLLDIFHQIGKGVEPVQLGANPNQPFPQRPTREPMEAGSGRSR